MQEPDCAHSAFSGVDWHWHWPEEGRCGRVVASLSRSHARLTVWAIGWASEVQNFTHRCFGPKSGRDPGRGPTEGR